MMDDAATAGAMGVDAEPRMPLFRVTSWNPTQASVAEFASLESARIAIEQTTDFAWLDIECASLSVIEPELQRLIHLHPIAADALRDGPARAKVQDFGAQLLATMIFIHSLKTGERVGEVIDFLVTDRLLVTIQDRKGDCFDSVREQIRDESARVRKLGPYFLLLQLGRSIAQSYRPLFAEWEKKVDRLEDALTRRADRTMLHRIHQLRGHLVTYRECVIPIRESIRRRLSKQGGLTEEAALSLQELEDEFGALQVIVEFQTDRVQRLMDLYLNAIANRANEVMRVLTIISTIFMPLSFVASLYGMNFQAEDGANPWNMPELYWKYGYLFALGLMFVISISFLCFFWRKGWIGSLAQSDRKPSLEGLTQEFAGVIGLSNLAKGRRPRVTRATQPPMVRQR